MGVPLGGGVGVSEEGTRVEALATQEVCCEHSGAQQGLGPSLCSSCRWRWASEPQPAVIRLPWWQEPWQVGGRVLHRAS